MQTNFHSWKSYFLSCSVAKFKSPETLLLTLTIPFPWVKIMRLHTSKILLLSITMGKTKEPFSTKEHVGHCYPSKIMLKNIYKHFKYH